MSTSFLLPFCFSFLKQQLVWNELVSFLFVLQNKTLIQNRDHVDVDANWWFEELKKTFLSLSSFYFSFFTLWTCASLHRLSSLPFPSWVIFNCHDLSFKFHQKHPFLSIRCWRCWRAVWATEWLVPCLATLIGWHTSGLSCPFLSTCRPPTGQPGEVFW